MYIKSIMIEIFPTFLPILVLIIPVIILIISYIKKGSKTALIHFMYSCLVAFVIAGSIVTEKEIIIIIDDIEVTKTKYRVIVEYKTEILKIFNEKKYYDIINDDCEYRITTERNIFGYEVSKSINVGCYDKTVKL